MLTWLDFMLPDLFLQCLFGSWTHLVQNSERKVSVWKSESLPRLLIMEPEVLSPDKTAGRSSTGLLLTIRTPKATTCLVHDQVV